jgi:ATP-dependent Clp protease ATP-binding subunit ClpB
MEQVADIAEMQLERVKLRLAERRITLEVEPAALERIAIDGFDPVYGARPLKRVIQREVVDRIAKALVAGEVREGDTVVMDVIEDEIGIRAIRHEPR